MSAAVHTGKKILYLEAEHEDDIFKRAEINKKAVDDMAGAGDNADRICSNRICGAKGCYGGNRKNGGRLPKDHIDFIRTEWDKN